MAQQNTRQQQQAAAPRVSLNLDQYPVIADLAARFGLSAAEIVPVLRNTAFRVKGQQQATDAQIAALMVVAGQYKLNPFTKEIFAFPDKQGGIVPVVSVDGWARIINEHPAMDGLEFQRSEVMVTMDGGKPAPEWMEGVIYRKDRSRPIIVREYLDEVYQPIRKGRNENGPYEVIGPWQTHTKRFLRHKALIQTARLAFGFAGIYDEDEAQRIMDAQGAQAPMKTAIHEPQPASRGQVFEGEFSQVIDEAEQASGEAEPEGSQGQPAETGEAADMPKAMSDLLNSKARQAGLTLDDIRAGIGAEITVSSINRAFDFIKHNAKMAKA